VNLVIEITDLISRLHSPTGSQFTGPVIDNDPGFGGTGLQGAFWFISGNPGTSHPMKRPTWRAAIRDCSPRYGTVRPHHLESVPCRTRSFSVVISARSTASQKWKARLATPQTPISCPRSGSQCWICCNRNPGHPIHSEQKFPLLWAARRIYHGSGFLRSKRNVCSSRGELR
jgi:hypothetical protein